MTERMMGAESGRVKRRRCAWPTSRCAARCMIAASSSLVGAVSAAPPLGRGGDARVGSGLIVRGGAGIGLRIAGGNRVGPVGQVGERKRLLNAALDLHLAQIALAGELVLLARGLGVRCLAGHLGDEGGGGGIELDGLMRALAARGLARVHDDHAARC